MHYDSLGGGIEYVYKYIKVPKLFFVLIIYTHPYIYIYKLYMDGYN